jgi:hypothetical protein
MTGETIGRTGKRQAAPTDAPRNLPR